MASVRQRKDGRRFISFTDYDGKRRDLQIKGLTPEQLAEVGVLLDKLVYCRKWGVSPDSATMERLAQVSPVVGRKFVELGLVDRALVPSVAVPTLGEHCKDYLANRTHLKERTQKNETTAIKKLLQFIPAKTRVDRITAAQAQDYRGWLLRSTKDGGCGCAEATAAGYIKTAKRVFERAVDMGVLRQNPFKKVPVGSTSNPGRKKEPSGRNVSASVGRAPRNRSGALFRAFARLLRRASSSARGAGVEVLRYGNDLGAIRRRTLGL
ncbi:MAG: phage integrase SAM-like domain-containing protein [Thermoguttaceae bacterium]|nr:phage integrase SAM-like domain-containing protein [Thermoguttaceae bacterium]